MKPLFPTGIIRKTLRFRLLLFFTILSAVITSTFTGYYVVHQQKASISQLQNDAKLILSALKITVRLPLYAEYREGLATALAEALENRAVVSIRVYNHQGTLLSEGRGPAYTTRGKTITVKDDVFIKDANYTPESLLLGEDPKRSKSIGSIEITMDTSAVMSQLKTLYLVAMAIGFIFWLGTSIIGYILLRHITEPFQRLLAGIREIANGNLSPDIKYSKGDETEQAAVAVRELAAALREREEENRQLNDDLIRSMRLEVREEKKKIMAKLINTNRMTSLGLLVSSMAHEINNPNGSIRLSNEYVSKTWRAALPFLDQTAARGEFELCGLPYGEARQEVLTACDNIARCTVRIEHVIKDLRNYSLGERLQPDQKVRINEVASSAISILRAHGRRNDVTIDTELAEDVPEIKGNAKQLEQVLLNLIMNAAQALTEGRTRIRVASWYGAGTDTVTVEVADEGKGINPEDMQRLFDPFFSTRIDEGGSGLGLYIAKFIIDEHGGSISVESEVGVGTTFRVTLPCSRSDVQAT
jgi:signal transduction histidine kinase